MKNTLLSSFLLPLVAWGDDGVVGANVSTAEGRRLLPLPVCTPHSDASASGNLVAVAGQTNKVPSRNSDPRLLPVCWLHGIRREEEGNNTTSVNTIEDVIFSRQRQNPSSARMAEVTKLWEKTGVRRQSCGMLHPYGRFVQSTHDNQGILYVEIPKTSSSTMKAWLSLCRHPVLGGGNFGGGWAQKAPIFPPAQKAFVVVREPLKRFLSGYGTVRSRVLAFHQKSIIGHEKELQRFRTFVKTLTSEGGLVMARQGHDSCVWCHTLSQMWFIELYPHRIDFVVHLETLEADLKALKHAVPTISLPAVPPIHKNTKEADHVPGALTSDELIMGAPETIKDILVYLAHDYACLQYPPPAEEVQASNASRPPARVMKPVNLERGRAAEDPAADEASHRVDAIGDDLRSGPRKVLHGGIGHMTPQTGTTLIVDEALKLPPSEPPSLDKAHLIFFGLSSHNENVGKIYRENQRSSWLRWIHHENELAGPMGAGLAYRYFLHNETGTSETADLEHDVVVIPSNETHRCMRMAGGRKIHNCRSGKMVHWLLSWAVANTPAAFVVATEHDGFVCLPGLLGALPTFPPRSIFASITMPFQQFRGTPCPSHIFMEQTFVLYSRDILSRILGLALAGQERLFQHASWNQNMRPIVEYLAARQEVTIVRDPQNRLVMMGKPGGEKMRHGVLSSMGENDHEKRCNLGAIYLHLNSGARDLNTSQQLLRATELSPKNVMDANSTILGRACLASRCPLSITTKELEHGEPWWKCPSYGSL